MSINELRDIAFKLWKKVSAEKDPERKHKLRLEFEEARHQYRKATAKQGCC